MADDKRLAILKALTTQLETVLPANGYQHDLLGRVFRGRTAFYACDQEPPVVSLLERPDYDQTATQGAPTNPAKSEVWELILQGFANSAGPHPTDLAYPLQADCKKCLWEVSYEGGSAYRLGGLIEELELFPGAVLPPDPEKAAGLSTFILLMRVHFVEWINDPQRLTK